MKLLLSAYACEPGRGSESGVGWHWALELARRGVETWVMTRTNNREPIEAGLRDLPDLANLHFRYFDLPRWARWWKRGSRGIYLYNLLWQWGAYRKARRLHARNGFDRVHHLTLSGIRQPSFMGGLGIPMVFGPVGGGEEAPWALRHGYGPRGWARDALRSLSNATLRFDPFMRATFRKAHVIYVKTPDSTWVIPRQFHTKVRYELEIGCTSSRPSRIAEHRDGHGSTFRILYVGRFLYLKGMHLGLPAFAELADSHEDARLTMIGAGPDEARWRRLAEKLGVDARITWVPWLAQDELSTFYMKHDAFLFPSLHDSGGTVVLEALTHGLPVLCLDIGGPAATADKGCGRIVATKGRSEAEVSHALAEALRELADDTELRHALRDGALKRADELTWANQVRSVYAEFGVSDADCFD